MEDQPSAAPHANWNERITAECYLPNSEARVLGEDGSEDRRINNYAFISSDWGPTLLQWIERSHPEVYGSILEADRDSARRFDGHGSAIAHAYNHTILPLSNSRDKRTQILWGIADFRHRFERDPAGMWLPETAVDLESLDLLAAAGIRFTILAPHQAHEVLRHEETLDVSDGSIDTRFPYRVEVPSGRQIAVYFYNGPLSQEIAFNGLLEDGVRFADRLIEGVATGDGPMLSHVATDGETYGHHHHFGEMALARAIVTVESRPDTELTNYARFLELCPPQDTVRIKENTSWSCAHGVERWRSDCGCSTGRPGWDQKWRKPLRDALDSLRDSLIDDFEETEAGLLSDPWQARDEYIDVLLGSSVSDFIAEHQSQPLDATRAETAMGLLEVQHRAMLMYTSCGWFFDDITRIEAVFVLRQAGRAIDLNRRITGHDLEPRFLEAIEKAVSNESGVNGRDLFERHVSPFMGQASSPHVTQSTE